MEKPMDVLACYPIRKTKKQKQAFREDAVGYFQRLGYETRVEKGSLGSRNVVAGNPETAAYLVTAHYDTCARMPLPNFITPCNPWAYWGYQILVMAVIVLLALVPRILVEFFTDSSDLGELAAYGMLIALLFLTYAGPQNKSNANDNTSGVVGVLELAKLLPEKERGKVCFVLFDLEEAGLIGSMSYQSKHKKETRHQMVLNLDCVGDGDEIMLFPTKKLRRSPEKMDALRRGTGDAGTKSVTLREKGFAFYPSDQVSFPYGVGIAALRRSPRVGLYLSRIHTRRDTVLEEENIRVLRDQLTKIIAGNEDERNMTHETL